ncbi:MAG TPA: protein kinase [Pyrinomonadaceae bacterium]|nr:protein kinase [Pyrinomonadaceae bacterium]
MKYCTLCKAKYEDTVTFCTVDGEVLEEDHAALVETVLDGQYHIEAMLGQGGMGAVYRARHILLGDRVAIKVLPPHVRNNSDWLRRFRREGQAARRFRHPNSVTVHDLRTTPDGTTYMVMEYVQGHTLDAELKRRGRFTAQEAFEILSPIMSVLETAHSMGVVHRDLKPENIMVSIEDNGTPVVKLLDLGIAKMREIAGAESGNTALTMAGQVLGTPYYMSPEQWGEIPRDQSSEIDGRADIYSLGLVFYELLAGRRCYTGTTLHELRREHVSTPPRPISEVVPDIPKGFSAAITKAISKDRGDRQDTAKQLEAELRAGLEGSPPQRSRADVNVETLAGTVIETQSAGDTPTIITLDGSAETKIRETAVSGRSDATVIEHATDKSEIAPTIVERTPAVSSVTIPQVPTQTASVSQPVEKKKSKAPLAVAAIVLLMMAVGAGVGGFVLFNKWKSQPSNPAVTGGVTPNTSVAAQPVGNYWLELEQPDKNGSARVAGLVPIASGQTLKLHFTFSEDGYVYLIGPGGDTNQPTAFLTSRPPEGSGLTTNKVKRDTDFSFPGGSNWLGLDKNAGTDTFKVIFSKTPLNSPAFLDQPVTLQPLTPAQLNELNQLEAKYKDSKMVMELDDSNKLAPSMRIKAPPEQLENPIIFDIRIQHNNPTAGQ